MALPTRRVLPVLTAIAFALGVAACADDAAPDPAEYIAVKKAWLPGERDAYILRVMTNHELVFPYVGDISSMAPQLFADLDSHVVMAPNPAYSPSLTAPLPAPLPGLFMAPQFAASWNFIGLKITTVDNTNAPPDTVFWHLVVWSDPVSARDYGFAIAASRVNTFNNKVLKALAFDASFATVGGGAGEFHASTGTYWQDNNTNNGKFSITAQTYPGGFTTVTSGPYTGGLSRTGTQKGKVVGATLVRQSGAELPASFALAFDYTVTGVAATEIFCVFPTPCTTNVPGLMAARRRSALSRDSH